MRPLDKRVLVVGGTGFIGSHLVDRLLASGATVGVMARSTGVLESLPQRPGYELIDCDIRDAAATTLGIRNFAPQIVVHLCAHPDWAESHVQAERAIETNVMGTLNVLEGFHQAKGEFFLYGDSVKVFGNCEVPYRADTHPQPTSSYAMSKLAGWHLCELYARINGVHAASIRPTLVYGPRQRFNVISFVVNRVLDGQPAIELSGGHQTRDPLYIDDAIDAFMLAIRRGPAIAGRSIVIGGGSELTVQALGETIVRLMGGSQRVVTVAGTTRPTEIWRSFSDNAEALEMLGWQPSHDLATGLRRTIAWIGERQRAPMAAT